MGKICEILDNHFEFINKHRNIIEDEYDSQFKGYRDINQDEKAKYVSDKLIKLPIHENLQKLNFIKVIMDFDATCLYLSAMWDEKSVFPKIESGFAFKPQMNDVYVEAFNNQTFNQDGNESATLKIKYYNPPDLIFQHLPVKGKVKNIKVNRMQNGYLIDTVTSVDIQEIVKIGGKVIEIYEGVIYREDIVFQKSYRKMFAFRQKYKDKRNDLMQNLVKLIMNSL